MQNLVPLLERPDVISTTSPPNNLSSSPSLTLSTMSIATPPPGQYTVLRIKRKATDAPLSSLGASLLCPGAPSLLLPQNGRSCATALVAQSPLPSSDKLADM